MTSRSHWALRSLVAGSVAATLSFTLLGAPAQAEPAKPATVSQAKAQVDKLTTEASVIDQDYAAAQEKLATSKKKLATQDADLAKQRKKVDAMRTQVAKIALANYQQRNADTTATFFTSKQGNVFNRLSMMQQVTANQKVTLQRFQAEQANLNDMKVTAESEVATQQQAKADMADARKRSTAKVSEAKKVLAQLTEAQRQRIAAEQAAQDRRDKAAAERAQAQAQTEQSRTQSATRTNRSQHRPATTTQSTKKAKTHKAPASVPTSGRAGAAVAFAKSQLGKPYSYGATGPGSYDCSGLTGAAWRAAGVSLPRTSQAQYGVGRAVSRSQLQPGDLVFYYGLGHVAIYVGGGMVIHAPHSGTVVKYAPVGSMPYVGARRPG